MSDGMRPGWQAVVTNKTLGRVRRTVREFGSASKWRLVVDQLLKGATWELTFDGIVVAEGHGTDEAHAQEAAECGAVAALHDALDGPRGLRRVS